MHPRLFLRLFFSQALFFFLAPAQAHDLWLEKAPKPRGAASLGVGSVTTYTLWQGHAHSSHAGHNHVPYAPAVVTSVLCLPPSGPVQSLSPVQTYPVKVKVKGNCNALLLTTSTGYWSKTTWNTVNQSKDRVRGVIKSWRSEVSVKYLEHWTPTAGIPLGKGLEISPLNDPFRPRADHPLEIRVTLDGDPVAGAEVSPHGGKPALTGKEGIAVLESLSRHGARLISASVEKPLNDGKADSLQLSTLLQIGSIK